MISESYVPTLWFLSLYTELSNIHILKSAKQWNSQQKRFPLKRTIYQKDNANRGWYQLLGILVCWMQNLVSQQISSFPTIWFEFQIAPSSFPPSWISGCYATVYFYRWPLKNKTTGSELESGTTKKGSSSDLAQTKTVVEKEIEG